jgi:hypothetical protein
LSLDIRNARARPRLDHSAGSLQRARPFYEAVMAALGIARSAIDADTRSASVAYNRENDDAHTI